LDKEQLEQQANELEQQAKEIEQQAKEIEQLGNLLRAANREVNNLKRTLRHMPPSPTSKSAGATGADSRGGDEMALAEARKERESFETKVLEAETRSLNKKVQVLESALDHVSTVVDKTCAILRLQTTNFLQSSRSTHALAVEEVKKRDAEGSSDRCALTSLQVQLSVLQDQLTACELACKAHQLAAQHSKAQAAQALNASDAAKDTPLQALLIGALSPTPSALETPVRSRGNTPVALDLSSPSVASIAAECSMRMRDAWAQNETLMQVYLLLLSPNLGPCAPATSFKSSLS